MRIARPILALLIALSIAVLPAAAHVAMSGKTMDMADATEMSAMDDMACCPDKPQPVQKSMDDCASMAGCFLCFGFLGPAPSGIVSPIFATSAVIALARDPFDSQPAHPTFRPPRV
jgi:hypothetical protein